MAESLTRYVSVAVIWVLSWALLTGCATKLAPSVEPTISSQYLSIESAPPTAWPKDPPPPPETLDTFARRTSTGSEEDRAKAWEEANGPEDFQQEAQRLMQLLPSAEPDNFVQLRLVRDESVPTDPAPLLGAEVWFRERAAATLARYTTDERFFAREGGFSEADMEARRELWLDRLKFIDTSYTLSDDPTSGQIDIKLGITEAAFRELANEQGWSWDDGVRFTFASEQPPAFLDALLERQVRAFVREPSAPIVQLLALTIGTVVLDDGCFRLKGESRKPGPLVMFGYDTQLTRDEDGYPAVIDGDHRYRIGEVGAWGGPNKVRSGSRETRALRAACGDSEIVNVGSPQSLRLFALPFPDWVLDYARAKSLSYEDAWDEVIGCMARNEKRGRVGMEARNACIDQFNDR